MTNHRLTVTQKDAEQILAATFDGGWMCPECHHGASRPFTCGGPHRYVRKDGKLGKRKVYRFVKAVRVVPEVDR